VALDRFTGVDYALQVGRLKALVDRWHPDNIVAEANSMGQPIIDMLAHDGLPITPFQTTNASKAQIIDGLALALERGEVTLQDDPVLVGEMQAYEMESLPSGLIRYSAPDGMHDDTVMATAIGFWGVSDTGPLLLWGDK
jgi:phage terminase large subunit-like protein